MELVGCSGRLKVAKLFGIFPLCSKVVVGQFKVVAKMLLVCSGRFLVANLLLWFPRCSKVVVRQFKLVARGAVNWFLRCY